MITYISSIDYGYTWPWTHGHLIVAGVLLLVAWVLRKRLKWLAAIMAGLGVWALAGFFIVNYVLGYDAPTPLPVAAFMAGKSGEVLDIGCGSGRATIMVAQARPGVRVAALDNFSAQYIRDNGEDLLRRNLRAAGIANERVRVLRADMRQIPARDGEFDGVVSSYAIDHLNRAGIRKTLAEVNRVLKPGGEFLLLIIHNDAWMNVAYLPMMVHAHGLDREFWPDELAKVGLQKVEHGFLPGTAYFYYRKP